jgi:hypothetical protein
MIIPTIAKGPELAELIAADPEHAKRYEQCLRDIEACESVAGLKRCTSAANLGRGYGKEWTSHHGMVQRAAKNNIQLSDELRDFPAFLVHVGPKPHYERTGRLSLDKTNSKGYVLGHIRWQNPEGQTRNRKCSKFHLYKGQYYNDKQLAVLLSTLSGKPIKADAVKKRRQRDKNTVEQFQAVGVPYESGLGPVSDWDFPPAYVNKMAALFRVNHHKGETRIAFFIRWLRTREIPRLESLMLEPGATSEQRADLRELVRQCGHALSNAELELKKLQRENISKELANSVYQPFNPAVAETSDPNPTEYAKLKAYVSPVPPVFVSPFATDAPALPTNQSIPDATNAPVAVAEAGNAPATAGGLGALATPTGYEQASVLDPVFHERLVKDLARRCEAANILPEFVRRSAKPFLTAPELGWLQKYLQHPKEGRGLVLTGHHTVPPDIKFQAIAGALIRNFIDARVIPVHPLLSFVQDDELPDPTVLLIPNLYLVSQSKSFPDWMLHHLHDLLIQRRCSGKPTVVYVENLTKMEQAFGRVIAQQVTYGNEIVSTESAS